MSCDALMISPRSDAEEHDGGSGPAGEKIYWQEGGAQSSGDAKLHGPVEEHRHLWCQQVTQDLAPVAVSQCHATASCVCVCMCHNLRRLVEGEIFRIGMNLEDIKEIIDRNVCEQISPPHSSSNPTVKEPLHVTPLCMSPPSPPPPLHQVITCTQLRPNPSLSLILFTYWTDDLTFIFCYCNITKIDVFCPTSLCYAALIYICVHVCCSDVCADIQYTFSYSRKKKNNTSILLYTLFHRHIWASTVDNGNCPIE